MARLVRDGVGLGYDDKGDGDPPLLLVHGILCSRRYLAPQLTYFSPGHRTVSVDLRGHGQSDAPDEDYSIDGFVDDLGWMCEQLGLVRPVIVGHSLGGVIALAAAASRPDLVAGIVALDAVVVPPPSRAEVMQDLFARIRSGDHRAAVRDYFTSFFAPGDDPEQRRRILDEIGLVPPRIALSAWESSFAFDTAAAARACRVPFLYLDAGTPNVDLARLAELCPTLVVGRTVGAGHFLQLEVPDQVNAMIERFLAVEGLTGSPPAG